jgi:hypothetical protein
MVEMEVRKNWILPGCDLLLVVTSGITKLSTM